MLLQTRYEQDCYSRENERDGMGQIGQGIELSLKINVVYADKWQTEINDTIPNDHKQYSQFVIVQYHFYFICKVKQLQWTSIFLLV
jgi:O-glycosyl hydrolase